MSSPAPRLGADVHYRLTEDDVAFINDQFPHLPPFAEWDNRNPVHADQVYAAKIVRTFENDSTDANLQVFLDGRHTYWATLRPQGTGPGTWAWAA